MKSEEEARLVKDASKEAKEHDNVQLKAEEGFRLALEARRRVEEEDLGLNAEEARLKYEAEEHARLNSE